MACAIVRVDWPFTFPPELGGAALSPRDLSLSIISITAQLDLRLWFFYLGSVLLFGSCNCALGWYRFRGAIHFYPLPGRNGPPPRDLSLGGFHLGPAPLLARAIVGEPSPREGIALPLHLGRGRGASPLPGLSLGPRPFFDPCYKGCISLVNYKGSISIRQNGPNYLL